MEPIRIKFTKKYVGETIRALSWKQPYASLMLHGKIETRVWDTKYRGWVLICASQSPYTAGELLSISGEEQYSRIMKTTGMELGVKPRSWKKESLPPLGKAIAIGKLVGSVQMQSHTNLFSSNNLTVKKDIENLCFLEYYDYLWMHTYESVQAIEPFEWKGKQGWSTLNAEQMDKIVIL